MSLLASLQNFNRGYNVFRNTSQVIELMRDTDNNHTPPNSARRAHLIFQAVISGFDSARTLFPITPFMQVALLLSELGARVVNLGIGAYLLSRGHHNPLLKTNMAVNALNITRLALLTFAIIKLLPITFPVSVGIAALNYSDFLLRGRAWLHYRNNAIYA